MSLFGRAVHNEDDEADLSALSDRLQLSSAWSVWPLLANVPLLAPLAAQVRLSAEPRYPPDSWAVISTDGVIYANPFMLSSVDKWTFVLAHLLLHLGLRHRPTDDPARLAAYEVAVYALLRQHRIGGLADGFMRLMDDRTDADALYLDWQCDKLQFPSEWQSAGGTNAPDIIAGNGSDRGLSAERWAMLLTEGLIRCQLDKDSHYDAWATAGVNQPREALRWFVDNYPLLSALASNFKITEDRDVAAALNIEVAAVAAERMEMIFNPDARLTPLQTRFVVAHEMLHVGLLHHTRREGREPFLWNVACDFVINAWLIDLGVGEMPAGGLFNAAFAGMSSEAIYAELLQNLDYARQLSSFRGVGVGDILPDGARGQARKINGQDISNELLDGMLKEGIAAHMRGNRGLLPAGMLDTVTPRTAAAPPWKIDLAHWFDAHFDQNLPTRSYARQSRRQQSTPDIPRPRYAAPQLPDGSAIFGVLLDTSGSMDDRILGQGLGAIAAFAKKHQIKQIRLVFCDAEPHDEGYVNTERLTKPMPIRGRGGTKLQPAIDLLNEAADFPKDAPLLVITDGDCDTLTIERDHAFLLPANKRLPFVPIGPVFKLS